MAVQYDQGRFETRVREVEAGPRAREPGPEVRADEADLRAEDLRDRDRLAYAGTEPADQRTRVYGVTGDAVYAFLRITVGVILLAHGLLKLQDLSAWTAHVRELGVPMPAVMSLLSLGAELGGGIALILGLFTRFGALLVFVNLLVGILTVHAGHGLFTQNGGFEFPLTLLMASALFIAEGSRRFGLDARIWRAIRSKRDQTTRTRRHMGPRFAH